MFILNDAVCVRRIDIFYDIPETSGIDDIIPEKARYAVFFVLCFEKYSLQGTTQGRYLTGGVPPVRFSM